MLFTDNAHIKGHRCSQIIYLMASAVYQEQGQLPLALTQAFFLPLNNAANTSEFMTTNLHVIHLNNMYILNYYVRQTSLK